MIEIWQECEKFQTTSQKHADQGLVFWPWNTRNPLKKTHKQNDNTVPSTTCGVKQKELTKNELLTSENESTTLPSTTLPNNAQLNNNKETISQEQKINLENVPKIMNCEKTTIIKKPRM